MPLLTANSQAAIVKGACLRGLEGLKPVITHSRAHYGWSWGKRFRKGIDPEANAYTDPLTGEKMCSGRMEWVIPKVCIQRLILVTGNKTGASDVTDFWLYRENDWTKTSR